MKTLIGSARSGLTVFFERGVYAAIGMVGLLLLIGLLLIGSPYDHGLVGAIAAALIGIGFGKSECRKWEVTHHSHLGELVERRRLVWQLTPTGLMLQVIGWSGVAVLVVKLLRVI